MLINFVSPHMILDGVFINSNSPIFFVIFKIQNNLFFFPDEFSSTMSKGKYDFLYSTNNYCKLVNIA